MKKKIVLVVFLISSLIIPGWSQSKREEAENKVHDESIQRELTNTDDIIKSYLARIKLDPDSYSNYTKLGEAYIQKARETGDTAYYDKAEEALKRALELYPDSYATVVFLGQVSSSKHDFKSALDYAEKAVKLKPEDSYAYGILGDAYIELGDYDEAEKAYEKMLSLSPGFYSYSRLSYIKELRGDTEGAVQAMQKAIDHGSKQRLPEENMAWAYYILGEMYFNQGELEKAEDQYQASLRNYENYYYALAGLGKVKAGQKRYKEAIDLYNKAIAIVPLPLFISSLGEIYEKIGNMKEAKKQYELVEYIGLLSEVNKVIYNRELALFYADRDVKLDKALDLANTELKAKNDIYSYDTLAWVYYKRNQLQEAIDTSQKSLSLGTKDAKLYFHAGMIYYKLEDMDKARDHLNQALSINPYFHVLYSDVAEKTLKEIENKISSAKRD
jgi:tetratricopeptide (TPR) repeat protein